MFVLEKLIETNFLIIASSLFHKVSSCSWMFSTLITLSAKPAVLNALLICLTISADRIADLEAQAKTVPLRRLSASRGLLILSASTSSNAFNVSIIASSSTASISFIVSGSYKSFTTGIDRTILLAQLIKISLTKIVFSLIELYFSTRSFVVYEPSSNELINLVKLLIAFNSASQFVTF